jgi:hypothetical protein
VAAAPAVGSFAHDKPWVGCDNAAASAFRGRCYLSYTDFLHDRRIATRTSLDGGLTWGAAVESSDPTAAGLGAQPVVQPNGVLVVPFLANEVMAAVRSTDGGLSFSSRAVIAPVRAHSPAGLRAWHLPSSDLDGAGKIYVAWQDCSFRVGCSNPGSAVPNDIVYSTSPDGLAWTAPTRIPIDGVASDVDHVTPGLAVDPRTQGSGASIALVYYSLPSGSCSPATCRVGAGFIASADGGATWTTPVELSAQPMSLSWLADTSQGRMLGDYLSTSFTPAGGAVPVVALADPFDGIFHEAVFAGALAPPRSAPAAPPPSPSSTPPAPLAVTIGASRSAVVYGHNVLLSGVVSTKQAGELVDVTNVGAVTTTSGGRWQHVATPKVFSSYRARWRGTTSKTVSVGVRPLVLLSARRSGFVARAVAARSFGGRVVWLERRMRSGRWRVIARAVLNQRSQAPLHPSLPRGFSVVRAVLPLRQAHPGYLAGFSRPLRVRR